MLTITGLKCIYDTAKQGWLLELKLDGEPGTHRFPISGPADVDAFLDAFEDCTEAGFDPATGEVVFGFAFAGGEEFEDEDEGEEEDEDEETSRSDVELEDDEDEKADRKVS
jgi:hypothetical protein